MRTPDIPMEPGKLVMLVYCAIRTGIDRALRVRTSYDWDEEVSKDGLFAAGLSVLEILFKTQRVSPNLQTYLAFSGESYFVRITPKNHELSIWQHFFGWWMVVTAASGGFESKEATTLDVEHDFDEQWRAGLVLQTLMRYGADLQLTLKIELGETLSGRGGDLWLAYTLEMIPDAGKVLELEVAVNLKTRLIIDSCSYPYARPGEWNFPRRRR